MTWELASSRLCLRAMCLGDAARIATFVGNWNVAKMLAVVPFPYEEEDACQWVTSVCSCDAEGGTRTFAIDDGSGLIGAISFRKLRHIPEIGYWLGSPYWGQGLMSEAAGLAVGWLFTETPHKVLEAAAFVENRASLRVQEKLGFRQTDFGMAMSLARGYKVPEIRTRLERKWFDDKRAA